jgi:hypothetical protein
VPDPPARMMPLRFVMMCHPSVKGRRGYRPAPRASRAGGCRRRLRCRLQSSRELSGRGAGNGYSVVGMSLHRHVEPANSKIASAKSAQDVSGAPAKWYVPASPGRFRQVRRDLQAGRRDVGGGRRPADLIGDDAQAVPRGAHAQHRLDEIGPVGGHHPGRAQDGEGTARSHHAGLPGQLGAPVGPQRRGRRVRRTGRVTRAVEDVVGRDMHEGDAQFRADLGHRRRCGAVDRGGEVFLLFRLVDAGIGGRVDHRLGPMRPDRRRTGRGVAQVRLGPAERYDIGLPRKLGRDLPRFAEYEDRHRQPALPRRSPTPVRACSARHQSSCPRYQSTVRARPSSTVTEGDQPSSSRMRLASMA